MPRPPSPAATRPARQDRSLRTQERILAAMEALLAEPDAGEFTMERLAERAHVSVGAIYKRFRGKESLLPLVLERVQEQQFARLTAFFEDRDWTAVGLAGRVEALLEAFAGSQMQRRQLIRALVVGHWQSDEPAPPRSAELVGAAHAWLAECSAEIRHPDPRLALSLGLFATLQSLQTAILFDRLPPTLPMKDFVGEMARMFVGYLQSPQA